MEVESMLKKIYENSEKQAILSEEFQSLRRDVERIGAGVDKINERHEKIRLSCADHCAKTDMALEKSEMAFREITEHEQSHLAWYGIILAASALIPIGLKKVLLILSKMFDKI